MNVDAGIDEFVVNITLAEVRARDFEAGGLGHKGEWPHAGARYSRNVDFHVIIIIQ